VEVSLYPLVGHAQGSSRPCIPGVPLQNDVAIASLSTTIVLPLTAGHNIKTAVSHLRAVKGD